jgi:hypothetical protein
LAFKLQTPVNHPEESIQHSEHGESLKPKTTAQPIKMEQFTETSAHKI